MVMSRKKDMLPTVMEAYEKGWISEERMRELAQPMIKNQYGQYLMKVIEELKETGVVNQ